MTDILEIVFDESKSSFDDIVCLIDRQSTVMTRESGKLVITGTIPVGVHQLSLQLVNESQYIEIVDVILNDASVRQMLYLSYSQIDDAPRVQPCTTLTNTKQKWIIPFANPMSFWFSLVYKNITNEEFGKDLGELYYIFYPEVTKLSDRFPQIVKTFFEQNFDFIAVNRNNPRGLLPFIPINKTPSPELTQNAHNEIMSKLEWVQKNVMDYGAQQQMYNLKEKYTSNWSKFWLLRDKQSQIPRSEFPDVYQLIDSFGFKNISNIYVGVLPSGSYLAPHVDDRWKSPDLNNKYFYIYIPVNWAPGNYFKFSGGPTLTKARPYIINNKDYVHSVVNDSDETRTVVGVWVDRNSNFSLLG
jgi:hypothetical protein